MPAATTPASSVRKIFPTDAGSPAQPLTFDDLVDLYGHPDGAGAGHPHESARRVSAPPASPRWLRANMVASADGGATVRGRTRELSGGADRQVFAVLRGLADMVLVGARTARVERYRPVRRSAVPAALRAGRIATPPIAVVSRRLDFDPDGPLMAEAPPEARTVVVTTARADAERRAAVARHADVVVAGEETVDLAEALAALADRGYQRVLTEGGPTLLAEFLAAGLLDELCLTVSPLLAGLGPARIVAGTDRAHGAAGGPGPGTLSDAVTAGAAVGRPLELAHVLESEGHLLCRYLVTDSR